MKKKKLKRSKKPAKDLSRVNFYIHSTFNNTIITVTDNSGNVVAWSTAGASGFKGAKKSTPFAASQAMKSLIQQLPINSINSANIYIKGVGSGRDSAARALTATGISITSIKDRTPLPHNGTRPKKPRKV